MPNHHDENVEKAGVEGAIGAHEATGMSEALLVKAQTAAEVEKSMSFRQAFKVFWRGGLWSMGLSVALM
jgi:hypothetical protein